MAKIGSRGVVPFGLGDETVGKARLVFQKHCFQAREGPFGG